VNIYLYLGGKVKEGFPPDPHVYVGVGGSGELSELAGKDRYEGFRRRGVF